ncbi:MAG: hypothetical protein K2O03_06140 [Lachnospiraceae bacterium]|nr:hypothetical protein [Lachnospiraceae bacterium]
MRIGRNKFGFCLALPIAACLAFVGCGDAGKEVMQEAPELIEPVDAVQENVYAQYRDVYSLQVMDTYVLPYQEGLSFERAGILKDVYVYVGQEVSEGDVLAELEDETAEECERLNAQLAQMREENAYNNRHLEIDIEIAKLSGQDASRMELQLKQQKELQAFEEEYLLGLLAKAEEGNGNSQIIAPFSGTITAIAEHWNGGAISGNTTLLMLAREDGRYLQADFISQEKIDSCYEYYALVDGERYELEYIPRTDEELRAMATGSQTKTVNYRMIGAQATELGENAFVCIVEEYRENVLALPKSVLYKERRDYYVYLVGEGQLVKTPVEVGIIGNHYAEIISGLEEGACVYVEK